jgi:hypothetical protein
LPPYKGQGKPSPYKTCLVAAPPRYASCKPAALWCDRREQPQALKNRPVLHIENLTSNGDLILVRELDERLGFDNGNFG